MSSAYTTQVIDRNGHTPTYAAAALTGDTFSAGPSTYLHVKNGSGSSVTVTVTTPGQFNGLTVGPYTMAVPATSEKLFGPFPPGVFTADGSTVDVAYSAVTTVTVAALQFAG
jgi:hypothetical protein